jgi:signal peptidase I
MKKSLIILNILIIAFVFVLGILISNILNPISDLPFGTSAELDSPSNWLEEGDIEVYNNKIILDVKDTRFVSIANTNSMEPILDNGANAIEILPEDINQINIGDIISFKLKSGETYIHRVVSKGKDEKGIYFITKGDNNPKIDPIIVRENQILGVVIGIFY